MKARKLSPSDNLKILTLLMFSPTTLADIASEFGVSKQRVHQIKRRAIMIGLEMHREQPRTEIEVG